MFSMYSDTMLLQCRPVYCKGELNHSAHGSVTENIEIIGWTASGLGDTDEYRGNLWCEHNVETYSKYNIYAYLWGTLPLIDFECSYLALK